MLSQHTPDVATLPIPQKGQYTYADYAELPEGAPCELIAGDLAMAPSPTFWHQQVSLRLSAAIFRYVEQRGGGEVVAAPMDVSLSEETTVQPDLIYVVSERREIISEQRIHGAPDLIVEILSPSTAHRDIGTKKRLYEEHGVREYWTVDPESKAVEIHVNTESGFQQQARVVESGSAASTVIDGFRVDVAELF